MAFSFGGPEMNPGAPTAGGILAGLIHHLLGGGAPAFQAPIAGFGPGGSFISQPGPGHGSLADYLTGRATGGMQPHYAPQFGPSSLAPSPGGMQPHYAPVAPPVRFGGDFGGGATLQPVNPIEHLLQIIHNLNPPLAQPLPNSVPPVPHAAPPHRQVPNPGTGLM